MKITRDKSHKPTPALKPSSPPSVRDITPQEWVKTEQCEELAFRFLQFHLSRAIHFSLFTPLSHNLHHLLERRHLSPAGGVLLERLEHLKLLRLAWQQIGA